MAETNHDIDEILERTTFNEYVKKYSEVDGYLMGYLYEQNKDRIDNFEVRDSDVWVTSYPKSGTTWTQEIVWLLMNNLNFEEAKKRSIDDRFPFIELETLYNWKLLDEKEGSETPKFLSNSIDHAINDQSEERCIKSHHPWNLLPKQIVENKKRPKIIHVIRNPKDVCVSFYHHHRLLHFYKGTFEEFKTLYLHDKVIYSPYWKLINSFWQRKDDPNILIIRYEDMKKDLRSVLIEIANFLNKPVPEDQMDKLLDHLSFKSMKNNASVNFKPKNMSGTKDEDLQFVRKGIVGDHKNIMSAETIAEFDKWIAERNILNIPF